MNHNDKKVRLNAVRILACVGEGCVFDELQKLAVKDNIDEEVKTVILEGMYKLEKAKLAKEPDRLHHTQFGGPIGDTL